MLKRPFDKLRTLLRAIWRRLTEPEDNMWLALLAAVIGLLGALWLLAHLVDLFEKIGR